MSPKKVPGLKQKKLNRITYAAGSLLILGALFLIASPVATRAFWPLASALAAGDEVPLVQDGALALLEAAVNPDPNPTKGQSDLLLTDGSALMANSGPEGTLPPAGDDSPSAGGSNSTIASYTVKDGDSISGIASSFGVSVNTILWANNLTAKSTIKPGMTLIVLPVSGLQYTVRKGDTIASIAKKYSADADEIATINGLDSGSLVTGTDIIVPGGKLATTAATPAKKPTTTKTPAKSPAVPSGLSSGGGASVSGWTNPLPGGLLTQSIHDNNAVDIAAPAGTPIYAAAGGTVIFTSSNGSYNHGWGNDVIVNHPNGTQTLYAHMSTVSASVGEKVSGGTVIGYVGRTGLATGNHLHFEVHGAKNPFAGCSVMTRCSLK